MPWHIFLFSLNIKIYFWRFDKRGTSLFYFLLSAQSIEQILMEAVSFDFHLGVSKIMRALNISKF